MTSTFINEIHYDNTGTDVNEGIEIAGLAGTNLANWSLVLYNGNGGAVYNTLSLTGTIPDLQNGFGTLFFSYPVNGIQNGSPDGIALVDNANAVVQFLSYEGTFTGVGGPANGLISTDIGVSETGSEALGLSLQLTGTGITYEEFTWSASATNTYNAINNGQTFGEGNPPTPTVAPIYEIQGSGLDSSFVNQTVTTNGVVVGDFQGENGLNGFYIQDAIGDGNSQTSDGIFVYAPNSIDVNVGDVVELTGSVSEFFNQTQLSNLTSLSIAGLGSVDVTQISLPVASETELEKYEGMLVQLPQTLTVNENYNLGRYGELVLSNGRLYTPTNVVEPGAAAIALQAQNDLNQIILDDGSNIQNPDPIVYPNPELTAFNTVRAGDTTTNLTGILGYGFNSYRIQPTIPPTFNDTNPRLETPKNIGGSLKVASFNVLNYFTTIDNGSNDARGADSPDEFTRQRAKIIEGILGTNADIIGLMEIENNGYGSESAIQDLVNGLNNTQSEYTYAFINPGLSQLGGDAIAVGLIYRTETVRPAGEAATLSNGAFSDLNRQPLAQTFEELSSGEKLTVAVNHFKSKGGGEDATGADLDQGDGQGAWNAIRTQAATELTNWLATDPTNSQDSDFLIIGDLNAYAKEDPIDTIKNAGYTNLIEQFVGEDAYSYVFEGQAGYLDHALASNSLTAQVTGATEWHINADEPRVLDYNTEFKTADQIDSLYNDDAFRSSDHDPVIVGLNLSSPQTPANQINGTSRPDILIGTHADDMISGYQGRDIIISGDGNDQLVYTGLQDRGDVIVDFEIGSDKLVLTQLFDSINYAGIDPIGDGYLQLNNGLLGTILQVDIDGANGRRPTRWFITVVGVSAAELSDSSNFVF